MADEQYRWLDRETAERLLSGEPLEAVDGDGGDQAEHLARTLGALSATPPLTSDELPGEAAAVAAFRKARAERADAVAARAATGGQDAPGVTDAGLVRIGSPGDGGTGTARRPRRARPARLALAAVLAVGMVGGVAVAAGTGVLGTPFGGDEPDPGASVSADVTPPERPLVSPSPNDDAQRGTTPGDVPDGSSTGGADAQGREEPDGEADRKPDSGGGADRPGDDHGAIASACRDLRDGKRLDADRRRALRDAAGGARVWKYCEGVLSSADSRSGQRRNDERTDQGRHHGNGNGTGKGAGRSGHHDRGQDREQDEADRKAGQQAGEQGGKKGDKADADRGR
ncbi:hypothetical protein [Streptomyces sp. NPDC012466]|uniref:hypothetical protein n=1 Tax=Streptomyces sp. NPDC012466 TaxID=3364835 RepID=UPI0036E4E876